MLFILSCLLFVAGVVYWTGAAIRMNNLVGQQRGQFIVVLASLGCMLLSVVHGYDFGIFLGVAAFSAGVLALVGVVSGIKECVKVGAFWFYPLFLIFFVRSFVYEPMRIPSASMEPGLKAGDFILVDKGTYGFKFPGMPALTLAQSQPERGDIVIFRHRGVLLIKRVVGLPGEEVSMVGNYVYVNGQRAENETIKPQHPDLMRSTRLVRETLDSVSYTTQLQGGPIYPNFTTNVPAGHVFVLGDNRNNSQDSRAYGAVPIVNIWGQAKWIWLRWPTLAQLPNFGIDDIE